MRLAPVTSININSTIAHKAVQKNSFKGLFSNKKPTANECFKYGLEALDERSLFIATTDRERSNFALNMYKDKIDIPINKIYTLDVTRENDKNWAREVDHNFAIFKKNNKYYILSLSQLFGFNVYKGNFDIDTSRLNAGEIRELEDGMIINVGTFKDDKLIFTPPNVFRTTNATKYLDVKTPDFTKQNDIAIKDFTAPPKIKSNSKEFTFADIGGLDHIIEDLRKFVIRPINYPQVFENIRLNKGILLYGPPRCGKTLIGKALANEAGVEFRYVNANEFKHGEVGKSESSVRNAIESLMEEPSILFIDELDAIAKQRDGSSNARYDDSLVNQILGSMSDLEKSTTNSFIIAATNRRDLLDKALLATGRFGLHLEVPLPNAEGIEQIFNIHAKNKSFDKDVSIKELIPFMLENKFNGSDIAEIITDGYFNALERLGLNRKMDARIFSYEDLKSIKINKADLKTAMNKIIKQKV